MTILTITIINDTDVHDKNYSNDKHNDPDKGKTITMTNNDIDIKTNNEQQ